MIAIAMDEESRQRVQSFLSALGPRLMADLHQALKTLAYQGAQAGVEKYFAGFGPKGGPASGLLTSRSGALADSLLASVEQYLDPSLPSADIGRITARIGSPLAYARIQEYGGTAGRTGPFKKKDGRRPYLPARPYLGPMFDDLRASLPAALNEVVQSTLQRI